MRVVREIPNPAYRTTILNWNNKYLIKLETAWLEQTYKIDQYEFGSDEELLKILDDEFIAQAMKRFEQMAADFKQAMDRSQA